MALIIVPESHIDHVPPAVRDWILNHFKDRSAFFIESVVMPDYLPVLDMDLVGPSVGDPPVQVNEVFYNRRGDRQYTSRLIRRPLRQTRLLTVIGGPHNGDQCVLYTAFGGPPAPKEPNDPTFGTLSDKEKSESRQFWLQHALACP